MFTSKAIPIIKDILSYFECKKCGDCCIESPIFLQDEEVNAYLKQHGTDFFDMLDETQIKNHLKHPCGFLEGKQCKMQNKIKPLTCMTYPFLSGYIDESFNRVRCSVGMNKRYRISYFYIALCPMGMEIDKEFLNFCRLNKLQVQDNRMPTQLDDGKTNKGDRIDYRNFGDKYLIPFYTFLKKTHQKIE